MLWPCGMAAEQPLQCSHQLLVLSHRAHHDLVLLVFLGRHALLPALLIVLDLVGSDPCKVRFLHGGTPMSAAMCALSDFCMWMAMPGTRVRDMRRVATSDQPPDTPCVNRWQTETDSHLAQEPAEQAVWFPGLDHVLHGDQFHAFERDQLGRPPRKPCKYHTQRRE